MMLNDLFNPRPGWTPPIRQMQTPGYGDGAWDAVDEIQRPEMAMPEPPKKRETWRDILGSVLDVIATTGGREGQYWEGVGQQQDAYNDRVAKAEEWNQQLTLADYKNQVEKRSRLQEAMRKALEPTAFQRNVDYVGGRWGQDAARDYVMKPNFVQNWDGTRTQVGGGDAPDELPADFFGEGGQTPRASGGF